MDSNVSPAGTGPAVPVVALRNVKAIAAFRAAIGRRHPRRVHGGLHRPAPAGNGPATAGGSAPSATTRATTTLEPPSEIRNSTPGPPLPPGPPPRPCSPTPHTAAPPLPRSPSPLPRSPAPRSPAPPLPLAPLPLTRRLKRVSAGAERVHKKLLASAADRDRSRRMRSAGGRVAGPRSTFLSSSSTQGLVPRTRNRHLADRCPRGGSDDLIAKCNEAIGRRGEGSDDLIAKCNEVIGRRGEGQMTSSRSAMRS